jgi:hypothetical protein
MTCILSLRRAPFPPVRLAVVANPVTDGGPITVAFAAITDYARWLTILTVAINPTVGESRTSRCRLAADADERGAATRAYSNKATKPADYASEPHFFTAAAMLGSAFAKSSGVITGKNSTLALSQRKNGSAIAGM